MKGDAKVNQCLNRALKNELTAISQYFLHARMCKNWGLDELNEKEYKISITAMKNADELVERILFLQGLPNLQDLGKLLIGENAAEILKGDYQIATETHKDLLEGITYCESHKDYQTREILEELLKDTEEDHTYWLEKQLGLIDKIGLQNYLQSQMGR